VPVTSTAADAHAEVLISGGGLVGMTLSIALARHGISSIVVDPLAPTQVLAPEWDGRASAIASASFRMLDALGLGDALAPHGCPIRKIWVSDGLKPGELDFTAAEDDVPLGTMFENRQLRLALTEAIAAEPLIHMRAPVTTQSITRDAHRATLTLTDGSVLTAPLLAVCEGRRSATREAAGIKVAQWSYRHGAMVGAISHAESHENVAYEIFYPSGPFAILPLNDLPDGRHRSGFVWSVGEADAPRYLKLGPRGFAREIERAMGGILGKVELIAPTASYPLGFHHAAQITADRLALVGDAGHGIHPIAGQGFNLGLRDVAALVEVLTDGARLGLDFGDAALLERYQRWRAADTLSLAVGLDVLTRLFGVPGKAASAVRRIGISGVQRAGLLKEFFMSEARGESAGGPKLLTGELV
jgi:2-octaprenyl-6-methoxyphenol hydroxylase